MVVTSKTNPDGSVTVYADGVKRVTHPAGSELAESSKQFETTPGNTAVYSGSSSSSSNNSSNNTPNIPTIYRDTDGNIYDENKNLLNMEEFKEYTRNGAIEGGTIEKPKSSEPKEKIEDADPNAQANEGYVNALYQEKYNRNATQEELDKFTKYNVKDASNLILGQELSPFSDTTTEDESPVIEKTGMTFEELTADMDLSKFSEDEIALLKSITEISFLEDDAIKQDMLGYLAQSMELADPYYKQQLQIVQDSIKRSFEGVETDYQRQEVDLVEKINQIQEDLTYNRGELTLEQSKDLAREELRLENELEQTRNTLAMRGLAFSGLRTKAEQQLESASEDIIGSTNREYDRKLRELQVSSGRSIEELQKEQERLAENRTTAIQELGRKGEAIVGTENVPSSLTGYRTLGSEIGTIGGSIQDEKLSNIQTLANTLESQKLLNNI